MSLDELRDATARAKKNEITSCELSRKRKLRELYAYTAFLNPQHHPPPALDTILLDSEPNEYELRYLDENDISQGRHFRDSTLPSPYENAKLSPKSTHLSVTSPQDALASPTANPVQAPVVKRPKRVSASPSRPDPIATPEPATANDAMPKRNQKSSSKASKPVPAPLNDAAPDDPLDSTSTEIATSQPDEATHDSDDTLANDVPEEPSVDPKQALPVTADDAANLPDSTLRDDDSGTSPRPPQVVHLPPKAEQEKHLEETTHALEKATETERKDDEKLGLPHVGDVASSPSSTMGQSTATPRPNQRSPDTSPEEETFPDGVSQMADTGKDRGYSERNPKGLQVSTGRGSTPDTPDAQIQLEREQAIREMRDSTKNHDVSGTVGVHALADSLTQTAEEIVKDVEPIPSLHLSGTTQEDNAQQHSLPTPSTTVADQLESSQGKPDVVPQESYRTPIKQTTPPADIDMEDVPLSATKDAQSTTRSPPARPERMVTRVSSGAMRQKSVSEILGETPHPSGTLTPRSGPVTPSRPRTAERKEKSRASTIVIAKPDVSRPSSAVQSLNEDYAALRGASQDESKDYLQGLFSYQAHHQPRSIPLQELLQSARKTVTTSNTLATLRECQDYKILKRVYQLQNANRWSLRQLQRCREPPRPTTHLDHVLAEMKWMSTDFREERKWKESIAATMAGWCADFVNSSPEEKAAKQIKVRQTSSHGNDEDMQDAPTPDLMPSGANETENESLPDDDELFVKFGANPPAGIFSLGFNDVVMKIDRTPALDELIQQLPSYEPIVESAFNELSPIPEPSILPVSKLCTGKLVSVVTGPPRKRSRYEYEQEDEPPSRPISRSQTTTEHSMPSTPGRRFNRNDLDPEMSDVALFNPENKHVRDRIQAGHAFRPPSEFAMPSTSFFESRASSQWLWEEDQKLRNFVKEYTFNWSLIASCMSMPSMFTSGPERRTPWECFERWVQLEGLPAEMSKTQYFRTYQSRLEAAQRTVSAQQQALQQQLQQQAQSAGQQLSSQVRRRTTQPIRVERRKNNRYLAIIDGMRKLARKRESAAHKQQESAKAAQLRKAHEPAAPKTSVHTPQEFSRLNWERTEKTRERQEQYRQQMQRQAAAVAQGQRPTQVQGQPNMPNGAGQPPRISTPNGSHIPSPLANSASTSQNSTSANMRGSGSHPGQPVMQGNFANGNMSGIPMGAPGIPQAPMQPNMQNRQGMPPPDSVRLAMQRSQFPNTNQHQFQLQQQQISLASSLTGGLNAGNGIPNQAMMASMGGQGMNGNSNLSMNSMQTSAGSPRMGQVNPAYQNATRPLSSGHHPVLNQMLASVRAQHPDWPAEQIQKQATQMMQKTVQAARNSAMSAATGSGSPMPTGNGFLPSVNGNNGVGVAASASPSSMQEYQRQLAQQTMNQRPQSHRQGQGIGSGSPQLGNARPPSRSASGTPGTAGVQSPGVKQASVVRN